jgi:serine/threonine-protein kinase
MSDIPPNLADALAGRYVLEREIGAGGMATVYLAQDIRHKRSVAVKVVRPELGGTEGLERFLREIELAARLQHPHILPVFDSGAVTDADGTSTPYFVMPYVEGETLRQRLQREGRLPVETATTLAAEVADALAYAHAHRVVHRDIKPENILLSGGHAVVADFGVARALEQGTAAESTVTPTRLTRAGIAIGTPHYMSPEQATGDVVDAHADQYSLGCVLFEMLTGVPPFTGPSYQSIIAKSLSAPRPHLRAMRPDVPRELDQAVVRAMALESSERYPDMSKFGAAISATRGASGLGARRRLLVASVVALLFAAALGGWLATRRSGHRVMPAAELLAVLPFHTSGPGVEFLGEGMVDLLATNLRGVGGIKTVDPRAVLQSWNGARAGGSDLSRALAVGRDLDAYSVVLGSAVSTGGRVRLAADLYTIDGERLGRAQVDGPADSVLGAVDRLSLALLRDVWRSREPLPNLRLASLTTDSIDALRSYLQGERHYRRLEWDSALSAYTRAVETDSTFALAHLRRAQVFGWTGGYGNAGAHEAIAAGVRFAKRLPPRDQRLMAGYQLFDQGKPAAIDSLRAFVTQYPDDVEGWFLLGEAMHHTTSFRPTAPDSVSAVFDRVLRRDSTLFPALIHPIDLALLYRDSSRFARYSRIIERTAPARTVSALDATAGLIWGPEPSDSALLAAMQDQPSWVVQPAFSTYRGEGATSDSVLRLFRRVQEAARGSPQILPRALMLRAHATAGLGRWRETQVLADSLSRLNRGMAVGVRAWAIALGLAPGSSPGFLDSVLAATRPGPEAEYGRAMVQMGRGDVAEGRRRLARALADSARMPPVYRGRLMAADGWGALMQGDTALGLKRLRSGLDQAAPAAAEQSGFLRLQLALALAAGNDTRAEGIRYLTYGFDSQPMYVPLIQLALGRTYEAAGQRDSAAMAYGRFIRFWDKADPELQEKVREAKEALQALTQERPGSR